jgi:hypothetical protein
MFASGQRFGERYGLSRISAGRYKHSQNMFCYERINWRATVFDALQRCANFYIVAFFKHVAHCTSAQCGDNQRLRSPCRNNHRNQLRLTRTQQRNEIDTAAVGQADVQESEAKLLQ